ncbi:MAG: DUF115 domain-containing protein [Spirochaetia bacterium]|nr:DUF115 domain-containing protein [Spirochaetia bacterium]
MDEIFNLFKSKTENDNYLIDFLDAKNVNYKVYSQRSLLREINTLNSKLKKSKKENKTLIWIAPFHEKIFFSLDKDLLKSLKWISPINFTSSKKDIIDNIDKLNFFLREINRKDSFSIELHVCFKTIGFQETFQNLMICLLKSSAVRLKTIAHFSTLWQNNFKHNLNKWILLPDILRMDFPLPDFLVLGGPSVDKSINKLKQNVNIWCADTALPALLHYNIIPKCVFTLDAGHGSYEHFITAIDKNKIPEMTVIIDPLSFPALFDLEFKKKFTCANSNPLIQQSKNNFTVIENSTDDVFGFMDSAFNLIYKNNAEIKLNPLDIRNHPEIIGHDGGHIKRATHLRGSAYHRRQYMRNTRLATPELYFYRLSFRYTRN